jgi:RHS repeat-associated protein
MFENHPLGPTIFSGSHCNLSSTGFNLDWEYDSFGNRKSQTNTGTASAPSAPTLGFSQGNNQTDPSNGIVYDQAGNVKTDNFGQTYTYDAEERITSMTSSGMSDVYAYEYDSDGNLVYENGSSGIREFLRNAAGQPLQIGRDGAYPTYPAFVDGEYIGYWYNSTFFWAGKNQVGTKNFASWGTGNVASTATPEAGGTYTSLPFGDALSSIGNDPLHFTGKERDAESGLDYFGARYYSSSLGRFMSPDWSAKEEPVPYAKLSNPQSLNLYAYVGNNPLSGVDPDGHFGCQGSTDGFCNPDVQNNMRQGMDPGDAYAGWQAQQQNGPTLPSNPSGLGNGWKDVTPQGGKNPKIPKRYRGPKGTEVEFDPGTAGKPGWGGKDHWHEVGPNGKREDGHLAPGTPIPGPDGVPDVPKPVPAEQRRFPVILGPILFNPSWIPDFHMPTLPPMPTLPSVPAWEW